MSILVRRYTASGDRFYTHNKNALRQVGHPAVKPMLRIIFLAIKIGNRPTRSYEPKIRVVSEGFSA